MTKTLKQRAVNSGYWVAGGFIFSQLLRLISNLILTRLLVPEMFGVMAIVNVFMIGIAMFSDVGLLQNVVQSKRGEDRSYLNTAWTIQIIRGGIIFLAALLLSVCLFYIRDSGWFATDSVYTVVQLPFLLALTAVTSLIAGFNSINLYVLNRNLLIKKVVILDILSQLFGLIVMLILAWYWRSVWVLVIGGIASAIVKMMLSHRTVFGERPKFELDKSCVLEIINFGKWIFLSSILGFMLAQGDRLMLGLWVTPELLGFYTIASFLANSFKSTINKLISSVFYPMLSEVVRSSPQDLKATYYSIRRKVDFIAMLIAGVLASMGHFVIEFLYDDRYSQVGWMFELLSISIMFVGYSVAGVCLMAKGSAKSSAVLTVVTTTYLYIFLPIAYFTFGIKAAVLVIALTFMLDIPTTFYMMHKKKLLSIKDEFKMVPVAVISYFIGSFLVRMIE
jgi:O-antigen/teichoic acid export membrane protein